MQISAPGVRPSSRSYEVIARGQVDDPTVSGDGQVFAWTRRAPSVSEIEMQRRGQEPLLVTDDDYADKKPVLNHDGSVCVWERFDRTGTESWDIYRLGPGDNEPQAVGAGPGPDWDPHVSDDGNSVVWGRYSPDYHERTAMLWRKDEGETGMSEPPVLSALPEIAGDGERAFFMRLAPANSSNQIWMQESDGYQKPLLYETDPHSRNNRHAFRTNDHGDWLTWVEKDGAGPASLFRWHLSDGFFEKVAQAPIISSIDISNDGQTMCWTQSEPGATSQVMLRHDGKTIQVTDDAEGNNATPTLSDDGHTLVWLWRHPKYLFPNEVRKLDI
ncbi:MAG: PD40 domain-containing protein [Candidatus Eremiobacteraeota bacterium]|nr:PD40 domain-containing protein [Candidatus Eremiobacteraeota bacterium]